MSMSRKVLSSTTGRIALSGSSMAFTSLAFRCMQLLEPWLFPPPAPACRQTPPVSFPMMVYAHRGGPLESAKLVENTMPAFQHAAAMGVDVLELDVQLSKDAQVVVCHDRDLGRLAPGYKGTAIRDLAYEQLPPVQAAGQPAGVQERMPLLSQIFSAFPDIPIQVDVKVDTPGLVKAVHALVQQHNRQDKLLWGSFIHKVQRELYARNPHIPLFTSGLRAIYLRVAHAAGQLDKVHIYESATIVPWRMPAQWRRVGLENAFLDRGFVKALEQRGVHTILFGSDLNDTQAYEACLAVGAHAICTDRPSLLKSYLASVTPTGNQEKQPL